MLQWIEKGQKVERATTMQASKQCSYSKSELVRRHKFHNLGVSVCTQKKTMSIKRTHYVCLVVNVDLNWIYFASPHGSIWYKSVFMWAKSKPVGLKPNSP